jgi:hypothetical protein
MSILIPGPETRVNTTTANDQWYAAMAGLSDGGYVVIWIRTTRIARPSTAGGGDGTSVGAGGSTYWLLSRRPHPGVRMAVGRFENADLQLLEHRLVLLLGSGGQGDGSKRLQHAGAIHRC